MLGTVGVAKERHIERKRGGQCDSEDCRVKLTWRGWRGGGGAGGGGRRGGGGDRGSVNRLAVGWRRAAPSHGGELTVCLPQFLCNLSRRKQTGDELRPFDRCVCVSGGGRGSKVSFYRLVELDLLLQVLLHDPVVVVDAVAVEVVHLSCGRQRHRGQRSVVRGPVCFGWLRLFPMCYLARCRT